MSLHFGANLRILLWTIIFLISSGHYIVPFFSSSSNPLTVELKGASIIDFVEAFFNNEFPLVLVSRLCSVNTTSVSWFMVCYSWLGLYILSIFLERYSFLITSFSFWVKISISPTASLSQGWLSTSYALSLFLGSTSNSYSIRFLAWSLSFGSVISYLPFMIRLWSSCILAALKGTVPISIA